MDKKMTVTWLGHSCFKVESGGYSIVLDPYADGNVPGLSYLRDEANLVLNSHSHDDHAGKRVIKYVKETVASPFRIEKLLTFHDEMEGALRGENLIHILDDGSFRAAHLGDIGCGLTQEQTERLKGVDVLMIPVGGYYTIDAGKAKKIVDQLSPRVVLPMHYRSEKFGYEVLAPVEEYLSLCYDVMYYQDNTMDITERTPTQTSVLTYQK